MRVVIFGGNGFVGSKLCPLLMEKGHEVTIFDLRPVEWFASYIGKGMAHAIRGDVRDIARVQEAMIGADAVIHLSCISNDPASELNPNLTRSVNLDCFKPCVESARESGVKRFIYASSSSVYGVKEELNVTEDLPLDPITDYSKYKAECEKILLDNKGKMEAVVVRPATICGYARNLRLDLCVHLLTISALRNKIIRVFGGSQYRPNIHLDDICEAYNLLLTSDGVDGEIYNIGHQNLTILDTAKMVQNVIGDVDIQIEPSTDPRSYHVSSDKIRNKLGYSAYRPIGQAIMELKEAWDNGLIGNPDDPKYHRIKGIKEMFGV